RVAAGKDDDARAELEPARHGGGEAEAGDRVGRRGGEALGQPEGVEAELLHGGHGVGQGAGFRVTVDAEAHADTDVHGPAFLRPVSTTMRPKTSLRCMAR